MSNESLDEARRLLGQPRFTVRPLRDDLVELHGWPTASDATLAFLTPILGPSATLILHRLGGYASEGDSVWTPRWFAATFSLGHDGNSAPAQFPRIAGQRAAYVASALRASRAGLRNAPTMRAQAEHLSDQEIVDLAAYYGAQTGLATHRSAWCGG